MRPSGRAATNTGATSTTTTTTAPMFMAYTTPNSKLPDWIEGSYCQYPFGTNAPCITSSKANAYYNAARS